jgi:predicted amidohydrolase
MFKLALVQMRVVGGAAQVNLARAVAGIDEAAAAGAQVVLLPEAMTLGWTHPSAVTLAEAIPDGESCQTLMAAASRHGVYVCAGLLERSGDQVFNAAVLIDPAGNIVLLHRKLNELEIAHGLYAQGDRLGVVDTPFGRFGVMICADAFAPGQMVSRTLALMGADVILSPSSWAVSTAHDNIRDPYGSLWLEQYGAVARDFQIWIAGVSNVGPLTAGPWQGQQCIGCSLVVDPTGAAALTGPYGVEADGVLYADIAPVPRPARGTGWTRG